MEDTTQRFYVALSHTSLGFVVFLITAALGAAVCVVHRQWQIHRAPLARLGLIALWPPLIVGLWLSLAGGCHFGCARSKARQATCSSHLKQIALGTMLYLQDNDDTYPPTKRWEASLLPYTKNPALRCPDAKLGSGYGMNAALGGVTLDTIDGNLSQTVLHFETDAPGPSASGGKASVAVERHGAAPHFAFVDGHVAYRNATVQKELLWTKAPNSGHSGKP